jgi:ring-1,2-phenylacetyl-CoA epoxidase subunit PaaD
MSTARAESVVASEQRAREVAGAVADPELPMLTLADLGVLRAVEVGPRGQVDVALTPTYSGCPAMDAMRDDVVRALTEAGFGPVTVRVRLSPPWSTDWLSERGRAALAAHGVSPPGPAPRRDGPVPLTLLPRRRDVACPRCGSGRTERTAEFGPTPCTALYRCTDCLEPFEHVKEI